MEFKTLESHHIEILKEKDSQKDGDDELKSILPAIGLLRANWKDQNEVISCFNYGTAFALTDRILVTCFHNIFNETKRQICSEILFYPGVSSDGLEQVEYFREARPKDYWESICYKMPMKSLKIYPLKEELCLISLERPLKTNKFIQICHSSFEIHDDTQMYVIGYPSSQYYYKFNISEIDAKRIIKKGIIHSINSEQTFIINHTVVSTTIGCSGGPILVKDKLGKFKVIGMHTHRGFSDDYNSGIYFNMEMQGVIKLYEQKLSEVYCLQSKIDYSQSVQKGYSVELNSLKRRQSEADSSLIFQTMNLQDDEEIQPSKMSLMAEGLDQTNKKMYSSNPEESIIENQSSFLMQESIYEQEGGETQIINNKVE